MNTEKFHVSPRAHCPQRRTCYCQNILQSTMKAVTDCSATGASVYLSYKDCVSIGRHGESTNKEKKNCRLPIKQCQEKTKEDVPRLKCAEGHRLADFKVRPEKCHNVREQPILEGGFTQTLLPIPAALLSTFLSFPFPFFLPVLLPSFLPCSLLIFISSIHHSIQPPTQHLPCMCNNQVFQTSVVQTTQCKPWTHHLLAAAPASKGPIFPCPQLQQRVQQSLPHLVIKRDQS